MSGIVAVMARHAAMNFGTAFGSQFREFRRAGQLIDLGPFRAALKFPAPSLNQQCSRPSLGTENAMSGAPSPDKSPVANAAM
jgi:hypothetical protein